MPNTMNIKSNHEPLSPVDEIQQEHLDSVLSTPYIEESPNDRGDYSKYQLH